MKQDLATPLYKHPFAASQLIPDVRFNLALAPWAIGSSLVLMWYFFISPQLPVLLPPFSAEFVISLAAAHLSRRLGYEVNKVYCRMRLGWNKQQIQQVFQYSELPDSWQKKAPQYIEPPCPYETWAKRRKRGKSSYILRRAAIAAIGASILVNYITLISLTYRLPLVVLVTILGAFTGSAYSAHYWERAEQEYQRYKKRKYSGQAH